MYNGAPLRIHVDMEKQWSIQCYKCVPVAFVIPHAKRLRRIL
jgi:hypothetical protein